MESIHWLLYSFIGGVCAQRAGGGHAQKPCVGAGHSRDQGFVTCMETLAARSGTYCLSHAS